VVTRFLLLAAIVSLSSCHYTDKFNRLLKNHPDLKALIYQDTIIVDSFEVKDTIVVFQKDTITIEGIRIIRGNMDSIRIIANVRPCTTYIRKAFVQPAKTKSEQRRYWQQKKYETKKQTQVAKVQARHQVTKPMFLFLGIIMGIFIGLIIKPKH
jgi:thioredoxin-related protein